MKNKSDLFEGELNEKTQMKEEFSKATLERCHL